VSQRNQNLCAYSGLVFLAMWLLGFGVIAGFLPPPAPNLSPDELSRYFAGHRTPIQIGVVMAMVGTGFLGPWLGALTVALKRIEGAYSPFTWANLGMSSILMVVAFAPLFYIQVIEFRPDHTPAEIQLLSDMTWLPFVGFTGPALVQWTCIGLAILHDKREHPILPRWAAYLNFWLTLLTVPAFALYFFTTGPLAWNGIFCFWVPLAAFGVWMIAMTYLMVTATNRQYREADEPSADDATTAAIEAVVRREIARLNQPL
jgi:hypothetical protein